MGPGGRNINKFVHRRPVMLMGERGVRMRFIARLLAWIVELEFSERGRDGALGLEERVVRPDALLSSNASGGWA